MKKQTFLSNHGKKLLILAFLYNCFIFFCSRPLAAGKPHYNMAIPLDDKIPVIPWMVVIYLGCYLFWAVNYVLAVRGDDRRGDRFVLGHMIGEAIVFLCFLFLPTTMERAQLAGENIWEKLLLLVYAVDPADNLFPSIHCFLSWMCWIGVRREDVPRWYRVFSFAFAVCVCISTVTVKQHVIVDVFSGVAVAEFGYAVAGFLDKRRKRA